MTGETGLRGVARGERAAAEKQAKNGGRDCYVRVFAKRKVKKKKLPSNLKKAGILSTVLATNESPKFHPKHKTKTSLVSQKEVPVGIAEHSNIIRFWEHVGEVSVCDSSSSSSSSSGGGGGVAAAAQQAFAELRQHQKARLLKIL